MPRPRKEANTTQPTTTETVTIVKPEAQSDNVSVGTGHLNREGLSPEREAMYAKYELHTGGLLTETPSENGDEKMEESEKEKPSEKIDTDTSPVEEEKKEFAKEEETKKEKETKTVPYEALHEEREKRKLAQQKLKDLESELGKTQSQLHEVLQDMKKLREEKDTEFLDDNEKKIRILEKKIAEFEAKDNQRVESTKEEAQAKAYENLNSLINKTTKELADNGYPGFEFLTHKISEELNKMIADEPDSKDYIIQTYDNPEGWKRIYKEKVYPAVKGIFIQKDKEDTFTKKKDAKTQANLVNTPGKNTQPSEKKDEDSWTYKDYLEERRRFNASRGL